MSYILGRYKYSGGRIYKVSLEIGPFRVYKCLKGEEYHNTYSGTKRVKELCGISEEVKDYSHLKQVVVGSKTEGKYLVHFENPEMFFKNDPLPAIIKPYYKDGKLDVTWYNGSSAVCYPSYFKVYEYDKS